MESEARNSLIQGKTLRDGVKGEEKEVCRVVRSSQQMMDTHDEASAVIVFFSFQTAFFKREQYIPLFDSCCHGETVVTALFKHFAFPSLHVAELLAMSVSPAPIDAPVGSLDILVPFIVTCSEDPALRN